MTRNQWSVFYYKVFVSIGYSPKSDILYPVYCERNLSWLTWGAE